MADLALVKELELLDDIQAICNDYELEYGNPPTNISTWDSSPDVVGTKFLNTLPEISGFQKNYIFSYILKDNFGLRKLLGYIDPKWKSLVSHSGSSSIVMTCNWLRCYGAKKILILGPRYFTVPHCLNALGMHFETLYCRRTPDGYRLPEDIDTTQYCGVWLTSPIYGTGVYINAEEIVQLQRKWAREEKFFILDECLASPEMYLGPHLIPHPKTTIIASPHKSVCANAYKFSISIFERSNLDHFEHWSDVWLGCLPQSSFLAIEHFRKGGFGMYRKNFDRAVATPTAEFLRLTKEIDIAEFDLSAKSYL